jgi:Kef-type K+ transport system membrane component KefB
MRFMSIFRISRAIIPYLLERGMSYLLERWWGLNGDTARRLGPLLSQGCRFAFVLLAADAIQGVMGEPTANLLKLAVTLSMAATSLDAGLDKEGRVPSLREESRPTRNKKNGSARGRY